MSIHSLRGSLSALALAAVAVLAAGCASAPDAGGAPDSGVSPGSAVPSGATTVPADGDRADPSSDDVAVAWLEDGRSFALITWGSSSCRPRVGEVTASGQEVTVTFVTESPQACTDDLAARGLYVPMPEGVDVTEDVDVAVVADDSTSAAALEGLPAAPRGEGGQEPSAGWFAEDGIALLTWGSSGCPPLIDEVRMTDAGARVAFAEDDRICTMDFAPRVTPLTLPAQADRGADFELTLVGNGMDATIRVHG